MTHIPGMPIDFDPPEEWKEVEGCKCRKCGSVLIKYRTHKASDGGWEDDEFKCDGCGYVWWVDGIDS